MKLSLRLRHIADMIPKCSCVADIGTDHGYIPIYCIVNEICQRAIASDINKGPIEISRKNIERYGIEDEIDTRVGPGLSVLKEGQADVIVIAGMGGILICDIIKEHIKIAQGASCLILQPVQYPEVLRKYLSMSDFCIVDEDIVKDENKYYHIIKVVKGKPANYEKEAYYYTGLVNIKKKHPLLKDYVSFKINSLERILNGINIDDQRERYTEIKELLDQFKDVLECL